MSEDKEGSKVGAIEHVDLTVEITEVPDDFWSLCDKVVSEDNSVSAVCKYCKQCLGCYKGSRGRLERVKSHFGFDTNGIRFPPTSKREYCPNNPLENTATKKRTIDKIYPQAVTATENQDFKVKFARWIYQTGTPFNKVSSPSLQKAINAIRPGVTVPNRKALAGPLLEAEFALCKKKVDEQLTKHGNLLCLSSDGWSTLDNIALINYMAVTSETAIFVDGKFSGERKTAKFIAEELHEMIQRLGGSEKVVGVVTDNAAPNKVAWRILEKEYPDMFFYGCMCHTLHLLVKDIFKVPNIAAVEENAKSIVKFFKNHQREAFHLAEIQEKEHLETLKLPGATRWGSLLVCFRSLIKNREVLDGIVTKDDFISSSDSKKARDSKEQVKSLVLDRTLFLNFEKLRDILTPITLWIDHFQSNEATISDAFHIFLDLNKRFTDLRTQGKIREDEEEILQLNLQKRWNCGYSDIHGLSYLLDPRYFGQGMEEENRDLTMKVLEDLKLRVEYAFYVGKCKKLNMMDALKRKELTVIAFLDSLTPADSEKFPNLYKYLLRIFSCVPSSASCERNFSDFAFINSKSRNRLKKEKVKMLTYIYSNSRILKEGTCTEEEIDEEQHDEHENFANETFTLNFDGFESEINVEFDENE